MREIKFRIWNSDLKYMMTRAFVIEPNGEIYCIDGEWLKDAIALQYTGLKDKNGKEVFEGDILGLEGEIFAPVTFSDGAFQMIAGGSNQGRSPIIQDRTKRLEVMGNIYETPELLEGK